MAEKQPDGSISLKSAQQETFAQLTASGRTQADAYRVAYPKSQRWAGNTLYEAASRLAADSKVHTRATYLRAEITLQAIAAAAVDKEYVLTRLKTVAERCLQAAPVVDRKGNPVLVETPEGGLAFAYDFNAMGANRALELLGKEAGLFIERKEQGRPGDFDKLQDKDVLKKRIRDRSVRLGLAKVIPMDKAKRKSA